MPDERPVPTRVKVTDVLGEYDHEIDFPEDQDFVIIYGPNGVGKTRFLEIIHALSTIDSQSLLRMPFTEASIHYSDQHYLKARIIERETESGDESEARSVEFILDTGTRRPIRWTSSGGGFERWLISKTPWRPMHSDLWEDQRDGELNTLEDLQEMYAERSPVPPEEVPDELKEHAASSSTFLIETHRLRINQQPNASRSWRVNRRNRSSSRISEQADIMRRLVNDAQTEHSRITQQLDRTFPNRVLEASSTAHESDADIRDRYNEQDIFRSRLGRVASVALEDALSLPPRDLKPFERGLLHLYLDDAEKKLDPFRKLLQKIELLEKIVNSRLLNKHLRVTASNGLVVLHNADERQIELDSLSSGEQHEIILLFDLLFNVPEGALVMIDEPEISLHVAWQLAFVSDVQQIADVAGFRFIVATHSPQIINDAWDHAVRLGPPEATFE